MKHFTLPKDGGLIEKDLPADILHSYEKIPAEIYEDQEDASAEIANIIISAIKGHTGGNFKLGLTTGTTPVSLYRELSAKYKEGAISFANVEVFSIDEYYPVGKNEAQSRNHRLHEEFLNNVDVRKENIHIPDGTVPKEKISVYCAEYDKAVSGLDLLVIGVGEQGQIGFNEAGSSEKSRTRTVLLSYKSRKAQSRNFNGNIADSIQFKRLDYNESDVAITDPYMRQPQAIGDYLLVAPAGQMTVNIIMFNDRNDVHYGEEPLHITLTPPDGTESFEAGKGYVVKLAIYGNQQIEAQIDIEPWVDGGSINIDPDDEINNY